MDKKRVIIIGGGAAGLTAAYRILEASNQYVPIIIEADDKVGGLAKTVFDEYGNGTDIGPHRFFSKNNEVINFWKKIFPFQNAPSVDDILLKREMCLSETGEDPQKTDNVFLIRKRFSRIYYKKHFIDYPIKLRLSTISAIRLLKTFSAGMSYICSVFRKLPEANLESFMINRFGKVLYRLFFEGYTQKVWGVHPSAISKDWGVQRIKGISLLGILYNAILSPFNLIKKKETSLIEEYYYPKMGSSSLWEAMADKIRQNGGVILLNTRVNQIVKNNNKIVSVNVTNDKTGKTEEISADIFISSMPVKDLLTNMNDVSDEIYNIADKLCYRDYILANYVVSNINLKNNTKWPTINNIAPDSWIYLQDNGIHAGRLDIMNNFSPYIISDFKNNFVINMEYFCNENDEFWNKDDCYIKEFGLEELKNLNILDNDNVKSSRIIRIKKAYPSYFGSYDSFYKIKDYINSIENLYCIGRNGQHKYNNMDHSILSGMVVSRIITQNHDKNILWDINTESDYQETKSL